MKITIEVEENTARGIMFALETMLENKKEAYYRSLGELRAVQERSEKEIEGFYRTTKENTIKDLGEDVDMALERVKRYEGYIAEVGKQTKHLV